MASIEIAGTHVEYLEQGAGEPVLLLHSSASSGAQWRPLAERLGGRHRVMAPDLYGYGGTGHWPGDGAFTLAQEARVVHALLGRLGGPAHLVGHSYGGAVALHVARTRPDLLRSLTVIEPVAFHLLEDQKEIRMVAGEVARAIACGDYDGGMRRFVDYWNGVGTWDALPRAKRSALAPRLAKVSLDFHATLSEPARLADFAPLALPTLVLQGDRSPTPTRRVCQMLAGMLPDAELSTVRGAGHLLPMTHADTVNELVAAHIGARAAAEIRAAA